MKKYLIIAPIVVILGFTLAGCSSYGTSNKSSNSAAVATNAVSAKNFAFDPANITVTAGTALTITTRILQTQTSTS